MIQFSSFASSFPKIKHPQAQSHVAFEHCHMYREFLCAVTISYAEKKKKNLGCSSHVLALRISSLFLRCSLKLGVEDMTDLFQTKPTLHLHGSLGGFFVIYIALQTQTLNQVEKI